MIQVVNLRMVDLLQHGLSCLQVKLTQLQIQLWKLLCSWGHIAVKGYCLQCLSHTRAARSVGSKRCLCCELLAASSRRGWSEPACKWPPLQMSGRLRPRGCSTEYISMERKNSLYRTRFNFQLGEYFPSVTCWCSTRTVILSCPKQKSSGMCQHFRDFLGSPQSQLGANAWQPSVLLLWGCSCS